VGGGLATVVGGIYMRVGEVVVSTTLRRHRIDSDSHGLSRLYRESGGHGY